MFINVWIHEIIQNSLTKLCIYKSILIKHKAYVVTLCVDWCHHVKARMNLKYITVNALKIDEVHMIF